MFFQLHNLKQLQTQSPSLDVTSAHLHSQFLLAVLQHNSLRCPLTTLSTKISLQLQFFSTPIHSAVYSSLFSNFLEIQKVSWSNREL